MYIIYNLLLVLIFIIYSPILIYKELTNTNKKNTKELFGFYANKIKSLATNNKVIWIHAVSVGETVAASPVVKELKKELPEYKLIFSTTTYTGQNMAHKIIEDADAIVYFPFDLPFAVNKALNIINPDLIMIIETELWPNFIKIANKRGHKIIYANGRISDSSYKKYNYLGSIMPDMLNNIDCLAMQSEQDKNRVIELGANEKKVFNLGNTKFDQNYSLISENKKEKYRKLFKINKDNLVFVAGSTHPDEEKHLIQIYQELKKEFPNLYFIVAPRDIERAAEINEIFKTNNIDAVKKTELKNNNSKKIEALILNTIGELAQIYSIADLVFVGGSMMGKGGHNVLEPAAQGKLVFFGPDMSNFKDSRDLLIKNDAGIQVNTWQSLKKELNYYLNNKNNLKNRGEKARKVILNNRGASKRILNHTLKIIKQKSCQHQD
ncbi:MULTISPECIES: 3-deoxy-D-manno-octulosonic acid transferase [Halanaerobium]|jgi:3-deoxy-D-manno-octulosonic-acid transferase|uniref:3-deoxy-D-manno-octulosonic acid transferase n=2 Tax=Halanaerobium TaxID=2330 RepID=A0A2T5RQJ8_9FIRM|nr:MULTISPECIES: 3-deoxy-D-manno-octulosonic acid transferase [Halanaerobium]PTW02229.1 3-deoxy-D-manno-octulosonic-acid transferase [Halanaerobium saccharolyticum]PUU89284.1 MAG: 3-deoxy-D-manno-octulosonic-acid transferase [Halanaerobium sp.]RCW62228.1 3-deoxy-D-manno-octulosonic-acid transferase [Halanaerobium sp. ST460_2HS_T2]TDQ01642.1 3-deoxy-D-manno-octulosonic-acid transferase [Halanaerobium saccharolyticum]SIR37999.1 3-deoxy-D-manno-octulosonic-acid transferase [Halanaerobium kushneri